jgi:hypothetical protein
MEWVFFAGVVIVILGRALHAPYHRSWSPFSSICSRFMDEISDSWMRKSSTNQNSNPANRIREILQCCNCLEYNFCFYLFHDYFFLVIKDLMFASQICGLNGVTLRLAMMFNTGKRKN